MHSYVLYSQSVASLIPISIESQCFVVVANTLNHKKWMRYNSEWMRKRKRRKHTVKHTSALVKVFPTAIAYTTARFMCVNQGDGWTNRTLILVYCFQFPRITFLCMCGLQRHSLNSTRCRFPNTASIRLTFTLLRVCYSV